MSTETNFEDYAAKVAEAEKAKRAAIDSAKAELASLEERRTYLKSIVGRKPRVTKAGKKPIEK